MRDQLAQYVNLLFAGDPGSEEIRQEILQNTLDRYDDLIAEGKTPESAYRTAISGIGDISEILSREPAPAEPAEPPVPRSNPRKKLLVSIAVALYILCPVPLFLLGGAPGLSLLLAIVAVATALIILSGSGQGKKQSQAPATPRQKLKKQIHSIVDALGLILYFIVSFGTGAWHITWLIFLIAGVINSLIDAILDLKEGA